MTSTKSKASIGSLVLVISTFVFLMQSEVYAASTFAVAPIFIDQTAEERDIFTHEITLTNLSDKPTRIYASVNEVNVADNTKILDFVPASMSDRTSSVTSWLEITRARLELPGSGELKVSLKIKINPKAVPGIYYAYIGFASGANVDEIEQKIKSGQGNGTILKISIADDSKEQISLVSFRADRFSYNDTDSKLTLIMENTGDVPLAPNGEVIIYNTKGTELSTVPVNEEGKIINPGERVEFSKTLPFVNSLGKNKAYLSLNYGVKNQASVFDTTFYYSVPWFYIAAFFFFLMTLFIVISLLIKRQFNSGAETLEHGVYELPLFVKQSHDHNKFDHDLDLKNEKKTD